MVSETSILDTKKYLWIKQLISVLIMLYLQDLKKGIKNPVYYQQYLSQYNDSLENVLEFWKNDAQFFLNFLFGHSVATKCMQKINSLVNEFELKLKQTGILPVQEINK